MYPTESGLYYLSSRYYNPAWGRFINADIFVSTGQGVLGSNMFAYCNNNPVMYSDPSGAFLSNFLKLMYYGFAHFMVQLDCYLKYNWKMEVYVTGAEGVGYLDLLDTSTNPNEYYEVKSKGVYKRGSYTKQLDKYDVSTIADSNGNQAIPSLRIGDGIKAGQREVSGEIPYGENRTIVYNWVKPGLIIYDIVSARESPVGATATQPAPASSTSLFSSFIPFGIPVPAGGYPGRVGELQFAYR